MVKFIATDLDGTLLDSKKKLPQEIFPLIEKMHEKGVLFSPASGRQYASLLEFFAPVADKVVFICENGALVKYRGETLFSDPIPEGSIKRALNEIRAIPHLFPMLCGVRSAYIENKEEPFRTYAHASYTACEETDNLDFVIGKEDICKIAVFDELPATEHCIKLLPPRLPDLRTILSGADWCDVSAPEADKGEAVRFLRRHFGLEREECVAFGDHMNDYGMLLECGRAFVPENAYAPLKEQIGQTVPSNDDNGVVLKIKELLGV